MAYLEPKSLYPPEPPSRGPQDPLPGRPEGVTSGPGPGGGNFPPGAPAAGGGKSGFLAPPELGEFLGCVPPERGRKIREGELLLGERASTVRSGVEFVGATLCSGAE